jgi:hypothetical protein
LEHQRQFKGQPLKNTSVRKPLPSWMEHFWILQIIEAIVPTVPCYFQTKQYLCQIKTEVLGSKRLNFALEMPQTSLKWLFRGAAYFGGNILWIFFDTLPRPSSAFRIENLDENKGPFLKSCFFEAQSVS